MKSSILMFSSSLEEFLVSRSETFLIQIQWSSDRGMFLFSISTRSDSTVTSFFIRELVFIVPKLRK